MRRWPATARTSPTCATAWNSRTARRRLKDTQFTVFQSALNGGGQVKLIRYPGGASLSRKEIDDLTALAKDFGAKGLAYLLVTEEGVKSPIAKFLTEDEIQGLVALAEGEPGDLVAFVADKPDVVAKVLDRLRREIATRLSLADPNTLAFCWVTDFPVFEWDEDAQSLDVRAQPVRHAPCRTSGPPGVRPRRLPRLLL